MKLTTPDPSLNKEGSFTTFSPSFVKEGVGGVVAYNKISLLPASNSTSDNAGISTRVGSSRQPRVAPRRPPAKAAAARRGVKLGIRERTPT